MAINHAAALAQYQELAQPGALRQAARYQLERIAHGLWVFIMGTDQAPNEVLTAYRQIQAELALRQHA